MKIIYVVYLGGMPGEKTGYWDILGNIGQANVAGKNRVDAINLLGRNFRR